jgi:hypothetical protein
MTHQKRCSFSLLDFYHTGMMIVILKLVHQAINLAIQNNSSRVLLAMHSEKPNFSNPLFATRFTSKCNSKQYRKFPFRFAPTTDADQPPWIEVSYLTVRVSVPQATLLEEIV